MYMCTVANSLSISADCKKFNISYDADTKPLIWWQLNSSLGVNNNGG